MMEQKSGYKNEVNCAIMKHYFPGNINKRIYCPVIFFIKFGNPPNMDNYNVYYGKCSEIVNVF